MITKQASREITPGVKVEKYTSEIFTININIMDGNITQIDIYPSKYPYPDIFVSPNKNIFIDFTKISSIMENQIETFNQNMAYTEKFIKNELKPFLETIK